jgi:type IV secretory pathway VirJ component
MRHGLREIGVFIGMCVLAFGAQAADAAQTQTYGRFGTLHIYLPQGEAREFVIFLSGDGGWELGILSMATRLRDKGAIVVGVEIRHYMAELEKASDKCVSPDVDLENLSHYLQAKLGIKHYLQPTLVGYSSGATLVYATLAESPDGLFKGALSLGFCPDLDLVKPLCKGSGIEASVQRDAKGVQKGVNFLAAKKLSGRWISLQGETDQVCPAPATQKFISEVPGGEIVMLPNVGHGYSVEKNWMPQYEAAFVRITAAPEKKPATLLAAPVADLPLTLVEPTEGKVSPYFAVFLSGDGGWVGLDRGVADELAQHGIAVVGWDSLKYFWEARTPQGAAADLDRVLRHYASAWGKAHALLVGYSQGADTMPFMVNRLPAATRSMVDLTALLGISDNALFEFHLANWVGSDSGGLPTRPELVRWSGSPYVCIYGEEDGDSVCSQLAGKNGTAVKLPGGHHFGGSYAEIATEILAHLPKS